MFSSIKILLKCFSQQHDPQIKQEYLQHGMMKRNAQQSLQSHSPYVFIPLYHVRLAYRMIPGEFWSIFCVEIKKACSMDFPAECLSSILETYLKT